MNYLSYHYEELLKLLVILSAEYELQLQAYTEDELAIDFDNALEPRSQQFVDNGYFTSEVLKKLLDINEFFDVRSGHDCRGFWTNIESHPDWETLRAMSKSVLIEMGLEKLKVKIDVKQEFNSNDEASAMKVKIELDECNL